MVMGRYMNGFWNIWASNHCFIIAFFLSETWISVSAGHYHHIWSAVFSANLDSRFVFLLSFLMMYSPHMILNKQGGNITPMFLSCWNKSVVMRSWVSTIRTDRIYGSQKAIGGPYYIYISWKIVPQFVVNTEVKELDADDKKQKPIFSITLAFMVQWILYLVCP